MLVNKNQDDVYIEATYAFLNLINNCPDFCKQLSYERRLIHRLLELIHVDNEQLIINCLKIFVSVTAQDSEKWNFQTLIGDEAGLDSPNNHFMFTISKYLTHKNGIFSYLAVLICANICLMSTEVNYQLSKNSLFKKILDHCVATIMDSSTRLVIRKEMIFLINNFILNVPMNGVYFFIRNDYVKSMCHILEHYNYAVSNNCTINYRTQSK